MKERDKTVNTHKYTKRTGIVLSPHDVYTVELIINHLHDDLRVYRMPVFIMRLCMIMYLHVIGNRTTSYDEITDTINKTNQPFTMFDVEHIVMHPHRVINVYRGYKNRGILGALIGTWNTDDVTTSHTDKLIKQLKDSIERIKLTDGDFARKTIRNTDPNTYVNDSRVRFAAILGVDINNIASIIPQCTAQQKIAGEHDAYASLLREYNELVARLAVIGKQLSKFTPV